MFFVSFHAVEPISSEWSLMAEVNPWEDSDISTPLSTEASF
jgi:hypothetical protein